MSSNLVWSNGPDPMIQRVTLMLFNSLGQERTGSLWIFCLYSDSYLDDSSVLLPGRTISFFRRLGAHFSELIKRCMEGFMSEAGPVTAALGARGSGSDVTDTPGYIELPDI